MTYKLELKVAISRALIPKKLQKKFDNKHELAEFLVNLCEEIYINFNSGEESKSEYMISNSNYGNYGEDCSEISLLEGDDKLIDYCMRKYGDQIIINNKVRSYFSSRDLPIWCGESARLFEKNYKKACSYLIKKTKFQPGNEN